MSEMEVDGWRSIGCHASCPSSIRGVRLKSGVLHGGGAGSPNAGAAGDQVPCVVPLKHAVVLVNKALEELTQGGPNAPEMPSSALSFRACVHRVAKSHCMNPRLSISFELRLPPPAHDRSSRHVASECGESQAAHGISATVRNPKRKPCGHASDGDDTLHAKSRRV